MKKIMKILTLPTTPKTKYFRGVTLLESLFVLFIIAAGLGLIFSAYKKFTLRRNAAQIQNSVMLLGKALEQYYNVNCYWFLTSYSSYNITASTNPAVIPAPTSGSTPALSAYIDTPQIIGNPYGSTTTGAAAYTYTVNVQGDFPVLSISTQFAAATSDATMATLQSILDPDVVNSTNKTFTWYTDSHYTLESQATGLNTNVSYLKALTPDYTNTANTSLANQYQNAAATPKEYTNVCAYWQTPSARCTITGNTTRCNYQNIGS